MARRKTAFWASKHNVDALRDLLNLLIGTGKPFSSPEMFHDIVTGELAFPEAELPKKRTLRAFIATDRKPTDPKPQLREHLHLTSLLKAGVALASKESGLAKHAVYLKAVGLLKDAPVRETAESGADGGPLAAVVAQRGWQLALGALHSTEADQKALSQRLFAGQNVEEGTGLRRRQYWCYRYHSHPGWIVKSLLVLREPQMPDHLFTTFECHFNPGPTTRRHSTGWVLAMGKSTYFFGQIEGGDGLKVIAVPNLETEQEAHSGLIMTMDPDSSVVTGRCVLIPTYADPKDGGGRIFDERKDQDDGLAYRAQFRNRMKFTLDSELWFEGRPIKQRAMVDTVARLLEDKFTFAGTNDVFNPADTVHYTYNVAVRKYDAANDDES
jgi:hypothetical protein